MGLNTTGTLPGGGLAGATPGSETKAVNWRSWAPTPAAAAPGGSQPWISGWRQAGRVYLCSAHLHGFRSGHSRAGTSTLKPSKWVAFGGPKYLWGHFCSLSRGERLKTNPWEGKSPKHPQTRADGWIQPFRGVSAWDCLTPPTLPAWGRPANGGRKSLSLSPGACYLGSVSSLFQAGQTRPDVGPN